MKFELHELCALFPRMVGEEFEALKADIKANGLRQPIVTYQGSVLDGGNRYQACMDLGIKPLMVEYTGSDLVGYVESANLHRRHLETKSQRVAIAVALHEWVDANIGRPRVAPSATLAKTNAQIAAQEHVAVRTVVDAKTAERAGLGQAVRDGALTAKQAASIARTGSPEPKKPTKSKPAKPAAVPVVDSAVAEKLDEAQQAVSVLSEENDRLNDRLAVVALQGTDEERRAAEETIFQLRAMVKTLTVELDAVKASRDSLMSENGELKRQLASQRKALAKLKA